MKRRSNDVRITEHSYVVSKVSTSAKQTSAAGRLNGLVPIGLRG
jgi:hypothetical protein